MPFDIAASARPATPVNKKKKWSNDFLSQKYADTDVESSMYRDAALHEPEETAAFRARRSARDRMLGGNGLNVGRTGSGERVNPMMPGAAGMGTGPSQVNPMMGDKAAWYVNKENQEPYDPDTANRQQRLLDLASGGSTPVKQWEQSGGWPFNRGDVPMDMGGSTESTAANRIAALKEIGGLPGAARAGLQDRFVSGSSLTRGPNDTPERTLQLDKIAAVRQGEKQRKLDLRGNVNDPTSIAGRIATRGAQKAFDRQQRMAGPTDEQRLMNMAANGNQNALAMLSIQAEGNRMRGIGQDRNRTLLDIANIENPQPSEAMQRQGLMSIWSETGGEAVNGPMEDYVERGLGGGAGAAVLSGTNPSDVAASARFGGLVTARESQELDQILQSGDPNVLVTYGRAKGWDDAKINKVMAKATGNPRQNTRSASGWGNFFGNYSTNPETGAVESDLARWKRRLGF